MSKEYIKRAELLKEMTKDEYSWQDYDEVYAAIDSIPAADVVEMVHGRWLQTTESLGWQDVDCVECSVCHETWVLEGDFDIEDYKAHWNYCPVCGAKMDEESEGDAE